ncbi:MAG TPA: hypothetical protein VES01_00655 [Dermatophilaceae bacterium]|nr:hypothetical protein [Dermatophilaceae bacterium]
MNPGSAMRRADWSLEPSVPHSAAAAASEDSTRVVSPICPSVTVRRAVSPADIDTARRLQAEVYLARHYIEPSDMVDGLIGVHLDPWVASSVYFVAVDPDGMPLAVSRQISARRVDQLPTMALGGLDPEVTAQLCRQGDDGVVEISALAVRPGAPNGTATLLYAGMWEHSRRRLHTAWVMAVHPVVWTHLNTSLGPVLEAFGPTLWYLGSNVVPAVLWTDTTATTIAGYVPESPSPRRQGLVSLFPASVARRVR